MKMNDTKTDKPTQEKIAALHEAAHAALMISYARKFKYVTLIPGQGYRAYVEPEDTEISGLFQLVCALEILFAGVIAQAHVRKLPPMLGMMRGKDKIAVTKLLNANEKFISRNEVEHFMTWVFFRAHLHLVQRWPAIELDRPGIAGREDADL